MRTYIFAMSTALVLVACGGSMSEPAMTVGAGALTGCGAVGSNLTVVTPGYLRVTAGYTTIIEPVAVGTTAKLLVSCPTSADSAEWYNVSVGGNTGWMRSDHLKGSPGLFGVTSIMRGATTDQSIATWEGAVGRTVQAQKWYDYTQSDGTGSTSIFPLKPDDVLQACIDNNMTCFMCFKPAYNPVQLADRNALQKLADIIAGN
jgi:hypothetical protein